MNSRPPKRFLEFDAFRIDVEERQLLRMGEPVTLTPKVFEILLILVENGGHTLAKDEIMQRVWPETFVGETNLNRNISTLRKTLGENSHNPRFIRTVPKRGFRFEGDVREWIEDDDEFIVERRTSYRVAIRSHTETQVTGGAISRFFSNRFATIAIPLSAVLIFTAAWAAFRGPSAAAPHAEAIAQYEKGRQFWHDRSAGGLHHATLYLENAVELDPRFALARAGLADAYAFDVENWKKAEAAANEAMLLDPSLGQPHATIGFLRMFWESRLLEAETHLRKAVTLSPDNATARQWYAINLAARERGADALAEIMTAHELDPSSVSINSDLCQILYFTRKYELATEQCLKTIEMDPNFLAARMSLYDIYTAREMYDEAVDAFLQAEQMKTSSFLGPGGPGRLRDAYEKGGIKAYWRERIVQLKGPMPDGAYRIAQYHVRLGENEEALRWIRQAYDDREFGLVLFIADPANTALFSDPRFTEIANKLRQEPGDPDGK